MGEQVHRLTDMEVEEVSLVDRPANKRPFLVVKRSEGMGTELRPDGSGGFTRVAETEKKLELPEGIQAGLVQELEKIGTLATDLAKEVKGGKEVKPKEGEPPTPLPEELKAGLGELKDAWGMLMGMLKPPAPAPQPGAEGEGAPSAEGMPGATPAPPGPSNTELRWREAEKAAVDAVVEKVGAKMSKDRLNRFKQALSVLMGMFNELAGEEAGAGPGAGAAPPAGAPQTSDPGGLGDVAARAPMTMSKADQDALVATLAQLTTKVGEMQTAQAQQNERITTIGKSRSAGNAVPVEGGNPRKQSDERVSWPLDMNRPIDRDSVTKQEFFG